MDITLERILSLIPKKENGDFVHGAKKKFAQEIGLDSGNVISDWVNGRSCSYKNYVYQIASIYGVSVAWLKGEGETETKEKSAAQGRATLHDTDYDKLSDANRAIIDDLIAKLLKSQSDD